MWILLLAFLAVPPAFGAEFAEVLKVEGQASRYSPNEVFKPKAKPNTKPKSQKHMKMMAKVEDKPVPIQVGDKLLPESVVTVGPSSSVTLRLGNDVVSLIQENTSVRLQLKEEQDWSVFLLGGSLLSRVENPKKRKEHFTVRSRSLTMGVRGTAFYVRQESGQPTYLCTCKGKVQVRHQDEKVLRDIQTTHHEAPIEIQDQNITASKAEPKHSDNDIASLEKLLKN